MRLLERLFGSKQGPARGGTVASCPVPDPANEEDYVRSCLEAAFTDEKEERTFRTDPAFQQVLDPLKSQQYSAAIKAAESLLSRFSDFDLPYKWLASAYRSTDQLQRSREVLGGGLAKVKRKSILLSDMGETEWRMGNIHQAVYCWCQALHCLSSNPVVAYYDLYLLLSYVAKGCGLSDVEQRFLHRVDVLRAGQIRLELATADRLTSLVRGKVNSAMIRAVQGIDAMYLPRSDENSAPKAHGFACGEEGIRRDSIFLFFVRSSNRLYGQVLSTSSEEDWIQVAREKFSLPHADVILIQEDEWEAPTSSSLAPDALSANYPIFRKAIQNKLREYGVPATRLDLLTQNIRVSPPDPLSGLAIFYIVYNKEQ